MPSGPASDDVVWLVDQLSALGQQRMKLQDQIARIDGELRPVVVAAVRARVSWRQIHQLTGVAQSTINKWIKAAE